MADVVRFLTFLTAAASVGLAMLTVWTYAGVYRRHRTLVAEGRTEPWRGLLPLHVTLIGVSYLIFVLASVYATAERIDGALTWRGPTYLVANSIGAYAMWTILSSSRHRKFDLNVRLPGRR